MEDKHLTDDGTESEYVVGSILCHFNIEELRDLGPGGFPALYEDRQDNEVLYWIRWDGYGPEHDTLEPEEVLEGLEKLDEYKLRYGVVTERILLKSDNRGYAFFLREQKSVPVVHTEQWMERRRGRPRKETSRTNSTSKSKGCRPRKRASTTDSNELVSAGFEVSEDDLSPTRQRKHKSAARRTRMNKDGASRSGWSAASARGTLRLESVSFVPTNSNHCQRPQIDEGNPALLNTGQNAECADGSVALTRAQPAETASFTKAFDASSITGKTTGSDRAMEATGKRGPETIFEYDAQEQTTDGEDSHYLSTYAGGVLSGKHEKNSGLSQFSKEALSGNEGVDEFNPCQRAHEAHIAETEESRSSATHSPQGSPRRQTPSPTFDCHAGIQVELPFAPEAPPSIERVTASQDATTDATDTHLLRANPFANWIKDRTVLEPPSPVDKTNCSKGNHHAHTPPIDGRVPTDAVRTSKPLKGILKKPANQVAVVCAAEWRKSSVDAAESTAVRSTCQKRQDGRQLTSRAAQSHSPSLSAGPVSRPLPHGQLEERVLTFCDPFDTRKKHCEVRDRRHLDWHAALKYVRLVAENTDYFEEEDYEPVVFEVSGRNSW